MAQHLSAFSNYSEGGYLAFGINNDASFVSLEREQTDEIIQRLGNIARNNLNEPVSIDHAVVEFEGKMVLFIYIPESPEKPVFPRGKTIYDSYKRSAGQTVKMSKDAIKYQIALSSGLDFESQVSLQELRDEEVLNLIDYTSYFSLLEKNIPDSKDSVIEILEQEDIIKKTFSSWSITNLGAILFAKNIQSFKDLKRKVARVIVYKATSRLDANIDKEGAKGYASGFSGLMSYISDLLPTNEIIKEALRQNVKVYLVVAMREFVANALIHQDFQ